MKRLKLSENDGTPDLPIAAGIVAAIVIFSSLISLAAERFTAIYTEPVFAIMWSIFNTSLITIIILCYVFVRFRSHLNSILAKPRASLIKTGFYSYLLFLPCLFFLAMLSFRFFKNMGLDPQPQQILSVYMQTDSFYILSTMFFLSCVVAPFAEEVIFRGIIYPALKKSFPVPAAVIASSLFFALLHNEIFALVGLFGFGILLAYLFEKYDNLWISIGVHFFNNLLANIAVFIIKYAGIANKM